MGDLKSNKAGSVVIIGNSPEADAQTYKLLEQAGYEVVVCKNPARMLGIVDTKPKGWIPTIFIIDVLCPEMSGYELVRRVVEKFGSKKIPVAMTSKYKSTIDELESSNAGAVALIQSPLKASDIESVLEKERIKKIKSEVGSMVFDINHQ